MWIRPKNLHRMYCDKSAEYQEYIEIPDMPKVEVYDYLVEVLHCGCGELRPDDYEIIDPVPTDILRAWINNIREHIECLESRVKNLEGQIANHSNRPITLRPIEIG